MTYPQDISQFASCWPLLSSSSFCILSYRGTFKSSSNTTLSFWSLGFCLRRLLCLYYLASSSRRFYFYMTVFVISYKKFLFRGLEPIWEYRAWGQRLPFSPLFCLLPLVSPLTLDWAAVSIISFLLSLNNLYIETISIYRKMVMIVQRVPLNSTAGFPCY